MEMDRLKTLLEKFRATAPHDKTRTMADVVEELARIVNDLDRRLKAIEGKGESASATSKESQEPHKAPENEFAFKDESPYDDPDVVDMVVPTPADNHK
jgi:hypothetical protein